MRPSDRLLQAREAAERLNRPEGTLRYWKSRGEGPPCFTIGKRTMYSEAALEAWIEQQRQLTGVAGGPLGQVSSSRSALTVLAMWLLLAIGAVTLS